MPNADESLGLAGQILTDVNAVVARLATLKADIDVLSNLAQGVAMTVDAALPAPAPPTGSLDATVSLGSAPEAV
ncbi:hypothetical protein SAMN04244553_4540 [Nocardia amikacinitolerans]|uniref:Uncharacterized protein n=1 Tax=Nocardia amikacinitolerans TaxID=756689 RepID=A0A285LRN7_9NOCA|nr:hypothetical protein [Nocardia amikacinitolerans]MCP2276455.1 hypothetical protein [Nocardia amikacinitolerans]MCP2295164.1 hypothetical protein [Nocardia amikacinitolerans]SNY87592.1 hypothetical protein SAMN04244553_4540 [Nocardia amikacinitolerans]